MAIAKIDFRIPWTTSAPRGPVSSNTFYCDTGGVALDAALAASLAALFAGMYDQTNELFMSSLCSTDLNWTVFDTADPIPRTPVNFGTFVLTTGADTLPAENAITVGFRAPRLPGVPRQRARGRVSLGPVCVNALNTATGLILEDVVDQIVLNIENILTALAAEPATWVVGSDAFGYNDIERLTVSNEFGQVHRRQLAATAQAVVLV